MFARVVEIAPKLDKKDELLKKVRQEILPILRKQPGFLELLPLVPENANEHMFVITLWSEKRDAEKYANEVLPRVELTVPVTARMYTLETSVCRNFVDALSHVA